ncbi:biopolymer transporter ExbD [Marinobacter halodurans]|uniref:Biopolymer transporter ExbD n=1 Tax=Marinobacter halodurans TaxID=2528979 RepID=A0ABY1ZHB4_9GAMM|nr:biopolymer transporter ExbD [Marinobacter halodurans]TBW46855.1 biopolymer transporter ExbD [Marinobacter halodurans]
MQLVEPRPHRRLPIRMTPLIDVVFILLVFFMVTSRLAPTSQLQLDNDTRASAGGDGEPLPSLVMQPDGRIQWGDRLETPAQLARALTRAGESEVNLETDGQVSLGDFTAGLTHLQDAGITTHWQRSSGGTASRQEAP